MSSWLDKRRRALSSAAFLYFGGGSALLDRHFPAPYWPLMATRTVTREQAERKKTQAAAFIERIGEHERADG
jgi:hypothetical protein